MRASSSSTFCAVAVAAKLDVQLYGLHEEFEKLISVERLMKTPKPSSKPHTLKKNLSLNRPQTFAQAVRLALKARQGEALLIAAQAGAKKEIKLQ